MEKCEWKVEFLKYGNKRELRADGKTLAIMEHDENGFWYLLNPADNKRTQLIDPRHVKGESVAAYTLWNYAVYSLMLQTPREKVTSKSPYGSIKDNEDSQRRPTDSPVWDFGDYSIPDKD